MADAQTGRAIGTVNNCIRTGVSSADPTRRRVRKTATKDHVSLYSGKKQFSGNTTQWDRKGHHHTDVGQKEMQRHQQRNRAETAPGSLLHPARRAAILASLDPPPPPLQGKAVSKVEWATALRGLDGAAGDAAGVPPAAGVVTPPGEELRPSDASPAHLLDPPVAAVSTPARGRDPVSALDAAGGGRPATQNNVQVGGKGAAAGALDFVRDWKEHGGKPKFDWRKHVKTVPQEEGGGGLCGLRRAGFRDSLRSDREMVFCLTTDAARRRPFVGFSWECDLHYQIVATVYRVLNGVESGTAVSLSGEHWGRLGFPDLGPAQVLNRVGGVYAALQMLALTERAAGLAATSLQNSRDALRPFHWGPRCVDVAGVTATAFERAKLTRLCNRQADVWSVLFAVFVGLWARAQELWGGGAGGAAANEATQWAAIARELERWVEAKPAEVLRAGQRAAGAAVTAHS